ncbi:hypothetical protein SAMN02927921_02155 [Sinomicrobium oceani]|uniref:Immunity protein 43 n=1 Tax=Sinomicrobium oceani TaxID=1150368 RepID=A0A1K1PYR4_9FLAO|nr:hypothetical protein [Sinomicrobium oceani]SFW52783.1 hypothetical protein SAMN02927921_02155 [Sinomicrobium oceani]
MNYYIYGWSDDLNVIGHYPQTKLREGYNPRNNGHFKVKPNVFPDFIPNLELDMHKKAKKTDFLGFSISNGIIVNKKCVQILEKHTLPHHHIYPIKVYQNGALLNYFWIHYIVNDFWDWLDIELSEAVIFDDKKIFEAVAPLDLNIPPDEFRNLEYFELPYHQHLRWDKIVFKKGFPYDLYQTRDVQILEIMSERLKETLEKENLTGFTTTLFNKTSMDNS